MRENESEREAEGKKAEGVTSTETEASTDNENNQRLNRETLLYKGQTWRVFKRSGLHNHGGSWHSLLQRQRQRFYN